MRAFGIYSFIFLGLLFLVPDGGHEYDRYCWTEWAKYIFSDGLGNIYKSWTDYLPLFHYVLYGYGKIQGSLEEIAADINTLKGFVLLFDLASAFLFYKILYKVYRDEYKAIVFSLFYLLNPAVLYNTMAWGQIDGILAFFMFASIVAAYGKKLFPAMLFFLLGLNLKLQAIVFAPLLLGLLLPVFARSNWKASLLALLGVFLVQLGILLPFILSGGMDRLWAVVGGSAGKYPVISMAAYNLWYLLISGSLSQLPDTTNFMGLSYFSWGLTLFLLTGFAAMFHLVRGNFLYFFGKGTAEPFSFRKVLLSAALAPLLFFFFNTQMHERYSHPALIFVAAYAVLYKRPAVLIISSIACWLNLDAVLRYAKFGSYGTLIFMPQFIAALFGITIVLLFIDLFRKEPLSYPENTTSASASPPKSPTAARSIPSAGSR